MKATIALYLAFAFTALAILPARPADVPTNNPAAPSAADIVKQSLAKYASLTSYSDEGVTVSTLGKTIAKSYLFTLRLARPNLYQIMWRQGDMVAGAAWSAGNGNLLWMGNGAEPKTFDDKDAALASATGISGGVAASLPGTFFKMKWGGLLNVNLIYTRAPDDKVGDVECFVLTRETSGHAQTLWIGKQDFLVHQIESDTSGKVVRATLEAQAEKNPQIRAMLDASGPEVYQDIKSIETHRNIVINPPLKPADFDYSPGKN